MGYFGTIILARPTAAVLSAQPEVRAAFGSRFLLPDRWNDRFALHELGEGWQRLTVRAFNSEPLRVAEGTEELVAATGAPALAGYVSESSCVHLEARTPAGLALSLHLPEAACGYEHPSGLDWHADPRATAATLRQWATEAGRAAREEQLAEIIAGTWSESPLVEDAVLALVAALGFPPGAPIQQVIDPEDPAFGRFGYEMMRIDRELSERSYLLANGYELGPEHDLSERELEYLRFRDALWGAVYGAGASRDELVAWWHQLIMRWGEPHESRYRSIMRWDEPHKP